MGAAIIISQGILESPQPTIVTDTSVTQGIPILSSQHIAVGLERVCHKKYSRT